MPVSLPGLDQYDVAGCDTEGLGLVLDDALSMGDHEYLLGRVVVPAIASTVLECDGSDALRGGVGIGDEFLRKNVAYEDVAGLLYRL